MTAIITVTSDPAITVTQDQADITVIVPVTQSLQTKLGISVSVALGAATDFNTVVVAGFYYTIDNLSANAPAASQFWYLNVDVDGANQSTFCRQIATTLTGSGTTYIRTQVGSVWGAWETVVTLDSLGRLPAVDGSQLTNIGFPNQVVRGAISGLQISTPGSSSSLSVTAGVAADSTNVAMMTLASAMSKTTGAWSAGNGNGGLDSSTITSNTWYAVHLIENIAGALGDILFSTSASAPTLPPGYTVFRRIGWMKTDGSSNWRKLFQSGNEFQLDVAVTDVSANTSVTSATSTFTLSSTPPASVQARLRILYNNTVTNGTGLLVWSGLQSSTQTVSANWTLSSPSTGVLGGMSIHIFTNASQQVFAVSTSSGNNTVYIIVDGWTDLRGTFL